MLDSRTRRFLATNLKGLLQDTLEWMEERNAQLREGTELGNATPAEARLFAHLRGRDRSISELARALGVSRQAVHHTVHGLAEHGVVEVVRSPQSRREKLVRITPRGREVQMLAARNLRRIEREMAKTIGRSGIEELRDLLVSHLEAVRSQSPPSE